MKKKWGGSSMEEISLEEFISSLDESYRKVFELLEDKTYIHFAKDLVPMMKEKGLTAETILFDEEIKAKVDPFIDGNEDKLLAIETLLKGFEHLENYLGSYDSEKINIGFEDTASKMVTYYMIQYILTKKAKKNVQ
ncbi:hypothetical protein RCG17_22250 [Neobacillus sp. PS3-12]|uniref:hypothetical protein n=1 Tax=Neobacillus sp. PS3-12 TaxID=3070677 RepID=UPI0027E1A303|nr:hypothetical protein [Neobacillus sp. PS3-12]WML52094.1 hypothetical protein RCG17_22250 [Neobacillus sp. PS3-12]